MLVGLVVGDISNSFFGQLTRHIEGGLLEQGYRLLIGSSCENQDAQRDHLDEMLDRGVDAIVIAPTGEAGLSVAKRKGVPIVLIDRPLRRVSLPFVGIDNHLAGQLIGEHLCRLGYRRVGVVRPATKGDPTIGWRLEGLREGLGAAAAIAWEYPHDIRNDYTSRERLARWLSEVSNGVEVVVGLTDDATILAMEAARDARLQVPLDLGLAGIDDFRAAALLDPPLTVVAQPIEKIARSAVDCVLSVMRGALPGTPELLAPQLLQRGSLRQLQI